MSAVNPILASKRINVLVYSGYGCTVESVRNCLYSLRRLLAPNYAVIPVTSDMIVKEPWTATCAMLVMPGGADQGYCKMLNGKGNQRISQFVHGGGTYLGFCAGGYYGSKKCEFEVGDKNLSVVSDRELGFFPGICRGSAFPGFVYQSEEGTRAAEISVLKGKFARNDIPEVLRCYHKGGGVFVDAPHYADKGVEVLATYTEGLHVNPGEGAAAIVYCKVGNGAAILTGPHPEFAAVNLDRNAGGPEYSKMVDTLATFDISRAKFLRACLAKLGLEVTQETTTVPSLSCLHLSSLDANDTHRLMTLLQDIITEDEGKEYLKDENDTFLVQRPGAWNMHELVETLPSRVENGFDKRGDSNDRIIDYDSIIKRLVVHEGIPPSKATPYFNHYAFYSNLKNYRSRSNHVLSQFGSQILYGEVVTSTNTLLERNTQLLRRLPNGFTATATIQIAGRGRGSNVWVSPAGALVFSIVIRHPIEKIKSAPVVFIQYLAAMAVVKGIKSYDRGYEDFPVKIKWPNDVYIRDPTDSKKESYAKICGILVNSHYSGREYISVVGIGLNTTNPSPTTSLNALLGRLNSVPKRQPFTLEKLLARILTVFEEFYTRFLQTGFDRDFEEAYYDYWLHMHQNVTLEEEGEVRARIKGITRDYGLLLAEELGWDNRPTGKVWQLQSDSNSFDFFRGLIKRKI